MTPFYIVARNNRDTATQVDTISTNFATQKKAIEHAKKYCTLQSPTYVFECVAKVEVPKPEPIITMKGD